MIRSVRIIGTGSYLPGTPVPASCTDDVLGSIPGLDARVAAQATRMERLLLARTGVRQRYYALDPATRRQTDTNATMAERAIRAACASAGITPDTLELLVVASPMADYACPPTSALVQAQLGIRECAEIEIHSNCTGTPKAIQIAFDMLRLGRYRRAAIAYTQISSLFLRAEYFNPAETRLENLALRWIMSDGAGALVLDAGSEATGLELVDAHIESIGGDASAGMRGFLHGGLAHDVALEGRSVLAALFESGEHHLMQDIGEVARTAPRHLVEGLARMLGRAGVAGGDVAEFLLGIPGRHFVTPEIAAYFHEKVGVPLDGRYDWSSVDDFGYCGGATMLVQLDRLVRSGTLKTGDIVAAYLEESSKWMSGGFVARA